MEKETEIRVLQVTGDPVGGIRKHVHSILSGLDPQMFKQSYAWGRLTVDARFKAELDGLRQGLGFALGLPIRKKPHPSDVINLYQLVRYIRRHKIDIVHGHGAKGGVYARALHMLCGVKAVYTPHGGSVHPFFPKWERRVYACIERALLPLTDYFVFESQYTANAYQALVDRSPTCATVNYNGVRLLSERELVATPGLQPQDLGDGLKIGVFAMLREIKGQRFAIEAVHLLQDAGAPVILHLFGEGPEREPLMHLCAVKGVSDRVVFHGDIANVQSYMQVMDIVLVPSLHESFGYVAVEARALGRYVIASRAGGLPEIIRDGINGALVEPGSSTAIAEAVQRHVRQEMQGKYIEASVDELQRFSLDAMLSRLAEIYRVVASGRDNSSLVNAGHFE